MELTNYKYGNTEFAIDISTIQVIVKNGQGKTVTIFFVNKDDPLIITFESYREREKFYEDILRDIEELNKPIEISAQSILSRDPYLYTDLSLRMKNIETERDDKRYCSTCAHLGEPGWLCFEECSDTYREAWIPKI